MTDEGELLWEPDAARIARARITEFAAWVDRHAGGPDGGPGGHGASNPTYDELWRWSVSDLDAFWSAVARWYGIRWHAEPSTALAHEAMPGAEWFPGGTLNYAEHLLFPPCEVDAGAVAVVAAREAGSQPAVAELTWGQLREQVASVRSFLVQVGVGVGDRVVGLVPNSVEALVAMLAATSLGAVWSSCSPDFGPRAVSDRFTQIEPTVLFAVDGYTYGGKDFPIASTVKRLRRELPTLRATVHIPYLDASSEPADGAVSWTALPTRTGDLAFEPVPFDAPLWILYSSGTTGLPKPIVHGHGGMLIEHAKQLTLHLDLRPGDRFFWFTTTGWMMWNLLVSGLAVGSTIVLYDGNPAFPDADALWQLAERAGITCLGVSAPFLQAGMRARLHPGADHDLSAIRTLGSTGAPLPPEGFAWVYEEVGRDLALSSLSGGTDVCTAFVGGAPVLPVHAGELSCRMLGCAVEAFDPEGAAVIAEVGELVITAPMPSMPVGFWNDDDGERLREAYFDTYPGIWRHGDWIKITERGSCVIYGRSDSTLNRGGVRMGTSEFYRVVEDQPGVVDSLVIDTSGAGGDGRLLLYVVLAEGTTVQDITAPLRADIRANLSPRHVPDEIVQIEAVPRTLNGKKCEVPVKRILAGVAAEQAVSRDALQNPDSLAPFIAAAAGER